VNGPLAQDIHGHRYSRLALIASVIDAAKRGCIAASVSGGAGTTGRGREASQEESTSVSLMAAHGGSSGGRAPAITLAAVTVRLAVSGELGSGKSTVARLLADRLGLRYVSTGAMQRAMAESLSMSTLDANKLAETDASIDDRIDQALADMGQEDVATVFDSRLAWWFVPHAFKVHLVVDATEGARRALSRGPTAAEHYDSLADALVAIEERFTSERTRFLDKYKIDIARLRNYDLVVDTTDAPAEAVADVVAAALNDDAAPSPRLLVSPSRLLPADRQADDPAVAYVRPAFFSLGPSLAEGPLAPARLVAEGDERLPDGRPARELAVAAGILDGHRNPGGST
jgi:cytidylate kinase